MNFVVKRINAVVADVRFFASDHAGDLREVARAMVAAGRVIVVFHSPLRDVALNMGGS